jgi:formylglycine-generating enzyme required for sulfatase activity
MGHPPDWYDEGYYRKAETQNPIGPTSGEFRVVRGGSWNNIFLDGYEAYLQCVSRFHWNPEESYDAIGFRCVWIP